MSTLTTSAPLKLSDIKTQFGGASTLYGYRRGGGLVASHAENAGISTTNPHILQFLGAGQNFESAGGATPWTKGTMTGGAASGGGGYTLVVVDTYAGVNQSGFWVGFTGGAPASGDVVGSYYNVGQSYSSTAVAALNGAYDWVQQQTQYPTATVTQTGIASLITFSGNVTGTWWTSVTVNGVNKTRSSASNTSGTYYSATNATVWFWYGGTYFNLGSLSDGASFNIVVAL
jgi:hypothetical protein